MSRLMTNQNTFENNYPIKVYRLDKTGVTGMRPHTHEYAQIWYILKGKCDHIVDDLTYAMSEKSLLVMPPTVEHCFANPDDGLQIIGCDFMMDVISSDISAAFSDGGHKLMKFAYIEAFASSIKKTSPHIKPAHSAGIKIEQVLLNMIDIYNNKKLFYEVDLKANLLLLLAIIARDYEKTDRQEEKSLYVDSIQEGIKYVEKNYSRRLTISQMAKYCSMSESYFVFFFKDVTGISFINYLNNYRIQIAKKLLTETDKTIADIGESVGFSDVAYFNKVFKKLIKITPANYRIINQTSNN